jgi:hypothetical protein
MVFSSGTLNTSTDGVNSGVLAITTETIITLDVSLDSGTHNNSRVMLQHSPDGIIWIDDTQSTNGSGSVTLIISTAFVRAFVLKGEGSVAAAKYFITAK